MSSVAKASEQEVQRCQIRAGGFRQIYKITLEMPIEGVRKTLWTFYWISRDGWCESTAQCVCRYLRFFASLYCASAAERLVWFLSCKILENPLCFRNQPLLFRFVTETCLRAPSGFMRLNTMASDARLCRWTPLSIRFPRRRWTEAIFRSGGLRCQST